MQAVLDEHDYQIIADKVLQQIKEDYDLIPKGYQIQRLDEWVGIEEFAKSLPYIHDKEWVRAFILPLPGLKKWVINLNAGKGYPVRVNKTQALAWIDKHYKEIDWNKSLKKDGGSMKCGH